ncbi:hypothetical protein BGX27_010274 [Mortierella sp. AM989]|nr:hypothetical protein BGX27_010274 [Mortierella sp. AM989]
MPTPNTAFDRSNSYQSYESRADDTIAYGPSSLDPNVVEGQEAVESRTISQGLDSKAAKSKLYRTAIILIMALLFEDSLQTILIDVKDYDEKVDDALPLEELLYENKALREMILSLKIEKKWLFTNAGKKHALRVIKCLGLEGCFDGLTYCDYLEPNFACKPETEAFRRAMRDAGVVHASNCYFVDDSAANVDKALDIGWTAVHVADDPVISTFGHFQIADILELPKVLPEFWESSNSSNSPPTNPSEV